MCFKKKSLVEENKQLKREFYDIAHTLCFTGHRSQKLPWGYNESDERCIDMRNRTKV